MNGNFVHFAKVKLNSADLERLKGKTKVEWQIDRSITDFEGIDRTIEYLLGPETNWIHFYYLPTEQEPQRKIASHLLKHKTVYSLFFSFDLLVNSHLLFFKTNISNSLRYVSFYGVKMSLKETHRIGQCIELASSLTEIRIEYLKTLEPYKAYYLYKAASSVQKAYFAVNSEYPEVIGLLEGLRRSKAGVRLKMIDIGHFEGDYNKLVMKREGCGKEILAKRFYACCERNLNFLAPWTKIDEITIEYESFSSNQ